MRRIDRLGDAVFRGLTRLGIGPAWTLTTRGRRTGELRQMPVIPISHGGRRWLVAPYGEVSWVHNARAAGQVDWVEAGPVSPTQSGRRRHSRLGRSSSSMCRLLAPPDPTLLRPQTRPSQLSSPRLTGTPCSN
jgi:F420H(2)-dependent quinone reductase